MVEEETGTYYSVVVDVEDVVDSEDDDVVMMVMTKIHWYHVFLRHYCDCYCHCWTSGESRNWYG